MKATKQFRRKGLKPAGEEGTGGVAGLYTQYGDRIYSFCLRLSGNAADAEDLAQDVFVAAHGALPDFEGRSTALTWLYRMALFRWIRIRDRPRPRTLSLEHSAERLLAGEDSCAIELERLSIQMALDALPAPLRESFLLVRAEGLKYREAAEILQVPQGTVQFRVHEATVRLRGLLEANQTSEGA